MKRFWSKTKHNYETDCMEWQGHINPNGYGTFWKDGRTRLAHKVAFELSKGDVPEGMVIDHLCSNRSCVNPHHLEVVTQKENVNRGAGNSSKTHCNKGHEFSGTNSHGRRICKICIAENSKRYRERRDSQC